MHLTKLKWAIIIPARYQSSRFPGKPLAQILGKSLIQRVWLQCIKAVDKANVFIATDDQRIENHVKEFGGQVVITSKDCLTGTDRVYEAAKKLNLTHAINVQGDEPLLNPDDLIKFVNLLHKKPGTILNGMTPIMDESEYRSPTVPKVVSSPSKRLLYMSRAPIPTTKTFEFINAYKQVCIYAFPIAQLEEFVADGVKTPIELIEDIEIIRFLEKDIEVQMVEVSNNSIAVDIPEDVKKVELKLNERT